MTETTTTPAASAQGRVVMRPMEFEDGRKGWYIDTDAFLCDIEQDLQGGWSVFFRDNKGGREAYGELQASASVERPAARNSDDELLSIAREVGLRQQLHGVCASDAKQLLRAFVDALGHQPISCSERPAANQFDTEDPRCLDGGAACEGCLLAGHCMGKAPSVDSVAPSIKRPAAASEGSGIAASDCELLELAAKAVGVDLAKEPEHQANCVHWWRHDGFCSCGTKWNPHTDDGDGARLEASLEFAVHWYPAGVLVGTVGGVCCFEYFRAHPDKQSARRLASNRAAAEIGRAMRERAGLPDQSLAASEPELWCTQIPGPDGLRAMPSREAADEAAAAHNQSTPAVAAQVIPWPHSREAHAYLLSGSLPVALELPRRDGLLDHGLAASESVTDEPEQMNKTSTEGDQS